MTIFVATEISILLLIVYSNLSRNWSIYLTLKFVSISFKCLICWRIVFRCENWNKDWGVHTQLHWFFCGLRLFSFWGFAWCLIRSRFCFIFLFLGNNLFRCLCMFGLFVDLLWKECCFWLKQSFNLLLTWWLFHFVSRLWSLLFKFWLFLSWGLNWKCFYRW